ncbi:MAG: NAD-dependent epimerase/dehydratase family protein [Alphaproteobacteria bacterium]
MRLKVLILGGDGFCGWPAALHLSDRGHAVCIADNLSRRRLDQALGTASLTPIRPIDERLKAWREASGKEISHAQIDLAQDYEALCDLLKTYRPDGIVHLAEQRSVPYSTATVEGMRYTLSNNLSVTNNLLVALVETGLDAHVVHMSSTGLYGYESLNYEIPEGYVSARLLLEDGVEQECEILHPANPLSVYALTKAQDQLALAHFAKMSRIRITDLVQGTVWGTQTEQTLRDERLCNRFDYDVTFGTVINRFALQAALGLPLTVYGEGRQTRAFIHVADSVRCIEIALNNPPARGERMKVFNQVAQTLGILELAQLVTKVLPSATIKLVDNPRIEPADNTLALTNYGLRRLGFAPKLVVDGLLEEIEQVAGPNAHRAALSTMDPQPASSQRRNADVVEKPLHVASRI